MKVVTEAKKKTDPFVKNEPVVLSGNTMTKPPVAKVTPKVAIPKAPEKVATIKK